MIKDYFLNYYVYQSDITVHLQSNEVEIHNHVTEPWQVAIMDTGLRTTTAERIYRIRDMVEEDFIVVYGDCVSSVDVSALIESHLSSGKLMTAVLAHPTGRNRVLSLDENGQIVPPEKKSYSADAWANACIMVVSPKALDDRPHSTDRFEVETVNKHAAIGQVNVYRHSGFWMPVETVRDRDYMQALWIRGNAPWRLWKD